MAASDCELIERAIRGDEAALTELLVRHGPIARRNIHNLFAWSAALELDDVMQVTYMEACRHITSFRPDGEDKFAAWLTRIARNNLNDAIRSLSRQKRAPPGRQMMAFDEATSAVGLFERLAATSTTPSRNAARAEVHEAVRAAIQSLPASYARVLEMLDLQGKSAAEAAASMDRSIGAVYILHSRALDHLRERLFGQQSACPADG